MRIDVLTMFNNWIPETSCWQAWAKPVAFTAMRDANLKTIERVQINRELSIQGIPEADSKTAVILDLDPTMTLDLGARLALEGYQPVPLFNAVPPPLAKPKPKAAVQLEPVIERLTAYSDDMGEIELPADAPPVFMITNNRKGRFKPGPGQFDNRWVVFPQDFPSGKLLLEQRIQQALIIQDHPGRVAEDLAHVLHGWQKAGVQLQLLAYGQDEPAAIQVSKPVGFGSFLRRTMVMMGLGRNAAGGFGSVVPTPSESSGYS